MFLPASLLQHLLHDTTWILSNTFCTSCGQTNDHIVLPRPPPQHHLNVPSIKKCVLFSGTRLGAGQA